MTSLLRPTQVADLFQVEERTVTRWLRDGYMRGYKLGKEWRIDSTELESFLERNVNNGPIPSARQSIKASMERRDRFERRRAQSFLQGSSG